MIELPLGNDVTLYPWIGFIDLLGRQAYAMAYVVSIGDQDVNY